MQEEIEEERKGNEGGTNGEGEVSNKNNAKGGMEEETKESMKVE
mgnify:CR=1 FL=1